MGYNFRNKLLHSLYIHAYRNLAIDVIICCNQSECPEILGNLCIVQCLASPDQEEPIASCYQGLIYAVRWIRCPRVVIASMVYEAGDHLTNPMSLTIKQKLIVQELGNFFAAKIYTPPKFDF